jgi:hypothetical protein
MNDQVGNRCACGALIAFYKSACDKCAAEYIASVKRIEALIPKELLAQARKDA